MKEDEIRRLVEEEEKRRRHYLGINVKRMAPILDGQMMSVYIEYAEDFIYNCLIELEKDLRENPKKHI